MHLKSNPVTSEYDLKEEIGRGSFSVCRRCVHKVTKQEYAAKVSGLKSPSIVCDELVTFALISNYRKPLWFFILWINGC